MTKLLSTSDAAHAVGVKPSTIRKWHERGKLTRYGAPRRPYWHVDELLAAIENPRRVRLDRLLDSVSRSRHHT